MESKYPQQPTIQDDRGVLRFKQNAIVRFLLDAGPYDMNALAMMTFPDADRAQFAQLIGYSVDGYSDLSYVEAQAASIAADARSGLMPTEQKVMDALLAAWEAFRNIPDSLPNAEVQKFRGAIHDAQYVLASLIVRRLYPTYWR